jgi:hypothetical protein
MFIVLYVMIPLFIQICVFIKRRLFISAIVRRDHFANLDKGAVRVSHSASGIALSKPEIGYLASLVYIC